MHCYLFAVAKCSAVTVNVNAVRSALLWVHCCLCCSDGECTAVFHVVMMNKLLSVLHCFDGGCTAVCFVL